VHPRDGISTIGVVILVGRTVPSALHEKSLLQSLYATMPAAASVGISEAGAAPATHVLVIGESTTSRHMSLYGYPRRTTPRLDNLRAQLDVVADACSSRGTTVAQMKELLSFATREDHCCSRNQA
jgi:heptose-I-phosphate ethanolaminephosphotransferase